MDYQAREREMPRNNGQKTGVSHITSTLPTKSNCHTVSIGRRRAFVEGAVDRTLREPAPALRAGGLVSADSSSPRYCYHPPNPQAT
jgi:hypothetical protein